MRTIDISDAVRSMRVHVAELTQKLRRMERALEHQQSRPTQKAVCLALETEFGYELWGQRFTARNGNDALVSILRHFAELAPEFPEQYSRAVKTLGRKRPYVARTVEAVYPGKPGLWKFTEVFAPGWYVGTNESNDKKLDLLRIACQTIGLRFGKDLKVRI
ncbi:hypothetical protein [Thiocystis violacea]|uniref:hypothetical protein n=1 Tax=Thiocystis violacea TaxID=13725 RepID=UPI001903553C|nr:hypothetical protein [Thiocystis violacea]MBK1719315.1 hypothetical protein [Thiocystis violacea]